MKKYKTFCRRCMEIKNHRKKLDASKSGMIVCNTCDSMNHLCTLKRINDGLIKLSSSVRFIEYENGAGKAAHKEPQIGFGVLLGNIVWQTTEITEIMEESDSYVHFKTKNSEYELFINY